MIVSQPYVPPKFFDAKTAGDICDQASLILAGMLPGCTARRDDFPALPSAYQSVELCFADSGPIMPKLSVKCSKYYSGASIALNYISMLRDPGDNSLPFLGHQISAQTRLEKGPAAMATAFRQAIDEVDFAGMIASGTAEGMLASKLTRLLPWPCFNLAQCAVYLSRDDEALGLLRDAIKYAKEDGRPNYGSVIGQAETYLAKLNTDPDALRQELGAMIDYNWSHLKVIGGIS